MNPLTSNTQAILLLTAPLLLGRGSSATDLLTLGEYNRLARMLRQKEKSPADLLGDSAEEILGWCSPRFDRARLEDLLGRGFLLSQAVQRWQGRGIWVVSRADAAYPRRLKARLKEDAPPLLYGSGEPSLLDTGGLAVVGSRNIDEATVTYANSIGRLTAEARLTLVSGGARGIDRAAMAGALSTDGKVVGIMADSMERAVVAHENREPLMQGRLALVSPYDPAAGFHVGNAMQRNKVIYALVDAALVVSADFQKGGTWEGAIEQLERLRLVPVFVRSDPSAGKGNVALLQRGGLSWPEPLTGFELAEAMRTGISDMAARPRQATLPFTLQEQAPSYPAKKPSVSDRKPPPSTSEGTEDKSQEE
ncbi:MAG TPA: DNA-processing protein DprA [Candidatus Paceibacterota bacterium]|nr:DNA-processing protein DprA [Verrucomicrobiota bacterium]HRY51386.1 DNA-processing protein DprA [Candidatus Paceibacterota bacterium]